MELYVSYRGSPETSLDLELEAAVGAKAHSSGYNLAKAVRDMQFTVPKKRGQTLLLSLNGKVVNRRLITVSDEMPSLF